MAAPRPQPRFPEPDTQPFWEATKRHELTYQTCNICHAVVFYPRSHCTKCGAGDLTRHVSQGVGTVYTFTVIMQSRHPGMKVADLLEVLKITKQSLGRVLKQLVDQGYVVQKEGENDRRQRLLFVTPKGEQLAMKLAGLQTERIARALGEIGPNAHDAARRFLVAMIDADGRDDVQKLIARADRARRPRS